jgi:hypothetical protein
VNKKYPQVGGRMRRHAEIATIVAAVFAGLGVVTAFLAWQWPVGSEQPGTGTAGAGPGAGPPAAETVAGASTTAPLPSGTTRFLTEMTPLAGQAYIEVDRDGKAFTLQCGSGVGDPSREVQYPLRGSYRKFDANVVVSEVEAPEVQTQFEVFADGVRVSNIVIDGKDSRAVSTADLDGVEVLALRLTCERRDTVVIVAQPRVSS